MGQVNVLVNDWCLFRGGTGVSVYLRNVLDHWPANAGVVPASFLETYHPMVRRRLARMAPAAETGKVACRSLRDFMRSARAPARPRPWLRRMWSKWYDRALKAARTKGQHAVYFEPNSLGVPCGGPIVATMHDLSVLEHPEWHPVDRVAHWERCIGESLLATTHWIVPSHFTRDRLITVLSVPPNRITVIALAPRWPGPMTPAPARPTDLPETYFLHLGNLEPRKNLLVLLDAWQLLPARLRESAALVLAGPLGSGDAAYWATLRDHPAAPAVRVTGYLGDRDVHALLTGATALLAPSRYEGFGLPILEAMACDTCVIHSSAGAYPEVAADAAFSIDPADIDGWAAAIRHAAEDSAWRADRILAGHRQAVEFSWDQTANDHVQLLSVLAGTPYR